MNKPASVQKPTRLSAALVVALFVALAGIAASQQSRYSSLGKAFTYREDFRGTTASGESYDPSALTASHETLPYGAMLRVTNVQTGKSVIVRVNDRPPFASGHVVGLTRSAAEAIGLIRQPNSDVSVVEYYAEEQRYPAASAQATRSQSDDGRARLLSNLIPVSRNSADHPENSGALSNPYAGAETSGRQAQNRQGTLIPVASRYAGTNNSAQSGSASMPPLTRAEDGQMVNHPQLHVQFGAFRERWNAEAAQAELRRHDVDTVIVHNTGNGPAYRLITRGVFYNPNNAQKWLRHIKRKTAGKYGDAFITP